VIPVAHENAGKRQLTLAGAGMQDSDPDALATLEQAIVQIETCLSGQRDHIAVLGRALSASRALLASLEATLDELYTRRAAMLARRPG
jgi:uncharacterized coiled-coil protein SlyX